MSSPTTSRNAAAPARLPWLTVALLGCAALALAGGLLHRPLLSVAAVGLLLLAWLPSLWRRHSVPALLAWLALAALLLVPAMFGHATLALMALPVVCLGGVSWLFARSLRHGREPLIARFIRIIEGDARLALPGVRRYARGVTIYWAVLLAVMALLSLLVALFARPGGWLAIAGIEPPLVLPGSLLSWYPEAGCWIVLVLAFAAEYLFRRWYLRGIPHPPVRRFVTQIVRRWPALVRGGDAAA